MTKEQRKLLARFAAHFADMNAFVVTRDVDELTAMHEACKAATETNCGWDTYRAARYLQGEIEREQRRRLEKRAASTDAALAK